MAVFPRELLDFAIVNAAANWLAWRRDWEHSGKPADLPVLADPSKCGTKGS
jgi:hypothetical protein